MNLVKHDNMGQNSRAADLVDLWQEITGVQLTSAHHAESPSPVQVEQPAGTSHDRLHRAASAMLCSPGHRPGTPELTEQLAEQPEATRAAQPAPDVAAEERT